MYVFPGKSLNVLVEFKLGEDPASPSLAAYRVVDSDGVVVESTPITIPAGETQVWITIDGDAHTLDPLLPYEQHRLEISYVINGLSFDNYMSYFVVPDLFLDYGIRNVRTLFGSTTMDLSDEHIDFYRSYIDLTSGPLAEAMVAALNGTDMQRKLAAKQLIFWHTMQTILPAVRMNMLKSVESETSKMTRMSNVSNFDALIDMIKNKYALYASLVAATTATTAPTLIVLDAPTDAITGA